MGNSIVLKLTCAIFVCMVMVAPHAKATITCSSVSSTLAPCLSYLTGKAEDASKACCSGVGGLLNMASTTADRQTICNCLKSASSQISNLNYDNAASLPGNCGVNIPYKISPTTDCTKVE